MSRNNKRKHLCGITWYINTERSKNSCELSQVPLMFFSVCLSSSSSFSNSGMSCWVKLVSLTDQPSLPLLEDCSSSALCIYVLHSHLESKFGHLLSLWLDKCLYVLKICLFFSIWPINVFEKLSPNICCVLDPNTRPMSVSDPISPHPYQVSDDVWNDGCPLSASLTTF